MKMRSTATVFASALIFLCVAGCSKHIVESDRNAMTPMDAVVLEMRMANQPTRLESGDPTVIAKVKAWLAGVVPRQPKPAELGAVRPWCTVSFFRQASSPPKLVSSQEVYMYADSSQQPRLLSDVEIQDLYSIWGLNRH